MSYNIMDEADTISMEDLKAASDLHDRTFGIKTAELDGKKIKYTDETEFLVQVGKDKGSYKTRWSFKGNLNSAVMYYRSLNIGNGFKKRLLMPACKKNPVLARYIS